jgi:hypothetical protein
VGLSAAFQLGGQLVSLFVEMFGPLDYPLNLSPIIVRKVNVYGVVITER